MKITIGHLFHDLLNLYGESGNILALDKALKQQGIEVEVRNLSINNEPWDLEDLDVLYIGAGTENNQMIALKTLMNYAETINNMIINNKHIIATGNSIELFGNVIKQENEEIKGLRLFDYITERTNKRIVSECVFNYNELDSKILGFENHQGSISGIIEPLFTVEKGFGFDLKSKGEGFRKNNFYGTYLIGPILVRNPQLLEKLCKDIILSKDETYELQPFDFKLELEAHNKFLNKYNKD